MENETQLPYIPSADELAQSDEQFLHEDGWIDADIGPHMLDVTRDYPINYTLRINGTPLAPLGGIHCQTGQPGHGKTMTLSMIAAAILGDTSHGIEWNMSDTLPEPTVLYIDTEMEQGNTMLVYKRIKSMIGDYQYNQPMQRLNVMCLRDCTSAEERWRLTLKALYELRPTVLILDGLIDVVADFNDNKNCQELIFKCMAAANHYGISFWMLIHENPGSEKMVGHAGSFIERKASDVIVTRKVKDGNHVKFSIKNKKVRGKDWEDLEFEVVDVPPFTFGIPQMIAAAEAPEPVEDTKFDVYNLTEEQLQPISMLITSHEGITTRDIREEVKRMFSIGGTKADKVLDKAVEFGIIIRADNKRYYLPDNATQEEAPF